MNNVKTTQSLLAFTGLIISSLVQAFVTVGTSPGFGNCEYTSIQAAIDADQDHIRILNNQTFTENLVIDSPIWIDGGYPTCNDANISNRTGVTTINGSANPGEPVIKITADETFDTYFRFYYLELEQADNASGFHISGTGGTIILTDSKVTDNSAENGGGIYFESDSNNLILYLNDTEISNNVASLKGGGIYCNRNSSLTSTTGNSIRLTSTLLMSANHATLAGGAIAAINGCNISINSLDSAVIETNTAGFGGAFSLENHSKLIAIGLVNQHLIISQNESISHGGAIYAVNANDLNIQNTDFNHNESTNGNGGAIHINGMDSNAIATSIYRSNFTGNSATYGAAIYAKDTGENTVVSINTSTFHHNGDGNDRSLIRGFGSNSVLTSIHIDHSTVADNNTDPSYSIIDVNNTELLEIENSIIHNSEYLVLNATNSNIHLTCALVNEDASIFGQVSQLRVVTNYNALGFMDPANGDYRLNYSSTAIDWCGEATSSSHNDIDNQLRGWDSPNIDNGFGTYDAGADESYIFDTIFASDFE